MNPAIESALLTDTVIDITTVGRKTGQPRRIEIWFHYLDGKVYITDIPGARSWYANMAANSDITFHLKESIQKDIPARVIPIRDVDEKRRIIERMYEVEERMRSGSIDSRVSRAPLVEIQLSS